MAVVLSALPALPRAVSACTPLTGTPARITAPGDYCLTRDLLHRGAEPAITLDADGVRLDLAGFTLSGPGLAGSVTAGVTTSSRAGIVVRNGRITGFRTGVDLAGHPSHGPVVEGLDVHSVHHVGIRAVGAGVIVRGCRVSDVGGSTVVGDLVPIGLWIAGRGAVVADNIVSGVRRPAAEGGEAVGIALNDGVGADVRDNLVVNAELEPDTWAIWLSPPMDVLVHGNLLAFFAVGIAFSGDSAGSYAANRFLGVTVPVVPEGVWRVRDAGGNRVVRRACHPVFELPWTITGPGRYCLVRNLSTAQEDGAAIEIAADDVVLDLGAFKLGGGAAGSATRAIGVLARDRVNVTVRHGDVRGFLVGVALLDASGAYASTGYAVEGVRADENTWMGVLVQGRGNVIRRNQVVRTTGTTLFDRADTFGIRSDGPFARVIDNDVVDAIGVGGGAGSGVAVYDATGSVVERNRVTTTGGGNEFGIRVASGEQVVAASNRLTGCRYGIVFQGAATGRYRDNLAAGVPEPYLPTGPPFDAGNNQ